LCSWIVNGKIALGNSLGFQDQIEDLRLNYHIPKENAKNNFGSGGAGGVGPG